MTPLPVPVPPMLEQAIGVPPDAGRHVGLYWGAGDELYHDDGRSSGTGHGHAWLLFARHPLIEPCLAGFDIGSCDREARHWIVLDRRDRQLSVAPVAEARKFLHQQWPGTEPVTLTDEEWDELVGRLRSAPPPTGEQLMAIIHEQHRVEAELRAWLDNHPMAVAARDAFARWLGGNR